MFKHAAAVLLAQFLGFLLPAYAAEKCDVARKNIVRAGAETSVSAPEKNTVAAGQPFNLRWTRGKVARHPMYLMISFSGPVRFDGEGLYALLPNAAAAFDIAHFKDKSRAVIPYYGYGAQSRGEVAVRPLEAGPLEVEWAVVGFDGCGEYVAEQGRGGFPIRVLAAGEPQIVVTDEPAGASPRERIASPAGGRRIEVYDGRYRLIESDSGAELSERPGQMPRFSPTGRYIAAYAEDGVEILDTIDGALVFKTANGRELAWDNKDSFAALNLGGWGAISIIAPAMADPIVLQGMGSCHACSGVMKTALRVDLENNVATFHGDQGIGVASLSSKVKADPRLTTSYFQGSPNNVVSFVTRQSPVSGFKLPKRWELRGGLKFSHLAQVNQKAESELLEQFLLEPLWEPAQERSAVFVKTDWTAQSRGFSVTSGLDANRNVWQRLEEFGVPVPAQAASTSNAIFRHELKTFATGPGQVLLESETVAVSALARQIEKEVQSARGVFVKEIADGGICRPDVNDDLSVRLYEQFQRAFRFSNDKRIIWIAHYQCAEGSAAYGYPTLELFDTASSSPWLIHLDTGNPQESPRNSCYANIAYCEVNAEIFGDRHLVLSSKDSRAIEVFDLQTRQRVFRKYELPRGDLLQRALLSSDGEIVLQINSDGTFAAFTTQRADLLFQGRYVDDEVVIWTPDARFDATAEGAHYVSLRLPGRAANYTFEQFSAQLRTPGLMALRLAGETTKPVKLVAPPSLTGKFEVTGTRISASGKADWETPVASLLVYQDGLLTDRVPFSSGNSSWKLDVPLLNGTRRVAVVAVDQSGLASLPIGSDVAMAAPRRVHLLAVGVDTYTDPRIPSLQLAQSDAIRFEAAVRNVASGNADISPLVLPGGDATRERVLAELREIVAAAEPGDSIVIFFAGHGLRNATGAYFFATSDTKFDDLEGSALPWSDMIDVLSKSRTRIAMFLDTCHSGAANTDRFSTNDAAAQSLLERIPSSIVVFSASKGRELAEETRAEGGGVFTSALIKVIGKDRARFDMNLNGTIDISELYRGVKTQVRELTGGKQTPWIARNQMVGDFALF